MKNELEWLEEELIVKKGKVHTKVVGYGSDGYIDLRVLELGCVLRIGTTHSDDDNFLTNQLRVFASTKLEIHYGNKLDFELPLEGFECYCDIWSITKDSE